MTNKEALAYLERKLAAASWRLEQGYLNSGLTQINARLVDALIPAVSALRELEERGNQCAHERCGVWVGEGDGYADGEIVLDVWYCSECNHCIDDGTDDPELLPKYCPECGAKMLRGGI